MRLASVRIFLPGNVVAYRLFQCLRRRLTSYCLGWLAGWLRGYRTDMVDSTACSVGVSGGTLGDCDLGRPGFLSTRGLHPRFGPRLVLVFELGVAQVVDGHKNTNRVIALRLSHSHLAIAVDAWICLGEQPMPKRWHRY